METQILLQPKQFNSFKLAARNLSIIGSDFSFELQDEKFNNYLVVKIKIKEIGLLFNLGLMTQINYDLSDEKFFQNKMKNQ